MGISSCMFGFTRRRASDPHRRKGGESMKIKTCAVLGAVLLGATGMAAAQDKANGRPFWVGDHSW